MNNSFPDITSCGIIGAGKVGLTLAEALFKHGLLNGLLPVQEIQKTGLRLFVKIESMSILK